MIDEYIGLLLASLADERVYGFKLPRGVTLPAITYMLISAPRDHTQEGPSGLVSARVQVSSWGLTYGAARELNQTVRRTLAGHRGAGLGVRVDAIMVIDERDLNEPEPDAYQTMTDFRVLYAEDQE